MFDIGFLELVVIGVLALLVLGPERLPGAIRTATLWISRLKRSFQQVKLELEREIDIQELKQQLHNESILHSLEKTKSDIEHDLQGARESLEKELADSPYNIEDTFRQHSDPDPDSDTLPYHEPLPDPDELEENSEAPPANASPDTDKP